MMIEICHDCGPLSWALIWATTTWTKRLIQSKHCPTPYWQPVLRMFRQKAKFCKYCRKILTLKSRLHRCRRGGGGVHCAELYFCCCTSHQTKPRSEKSPRNSTSASSSSFWMALRIFVAQCRFQDWSSCRAHTMAWPRCYTCSKLHTSLEALPCGDLK